MPIRNYTNYAQPVTLGAALTATATTVVAGTLTGWPAVPFTGVIDRASAVEEIVTVTAVATDGTLTIARGQDGTAGVAHVAGARMEHVVSARDHREAVKSDEPVFTAPPIVRRDNPAYSLQDSAGRAATLALATTGQSWSSKANAGDVVLRPEVASGGAVVLSGAANGSGGHVRVSNGSVQMFGPDGHATFGGYYVLGGPAGQPSWGMDVFGAVLRILGPAGEHAIFRPGGKVNLLRGIGIPDTRDTNPAPADAQFAADNGSRTTWEFKRAAAVGLAHGQGSNGYVIVQTVVFWGDDTGGGMMQMAYATEGMFLRHGTRAGGWGGWRRIQDSSWGAANTWTRQPEGGGSYNGIHNTAGANPNDPMTSGFYETAGGGSPTGNWVSMVHARHTNPANDYGMTIAGEFFGPRLYHRESNNGGAPAPNAGKGAWKEIAHSARGTYTGDNVNGRGIGLGFDPKMVIVWNPSQGYFHWGFHSNGLPSENSTGVYLANGYCYNTSDNGYRPYINGNGFFINMYYLNMSGQTYHYYAVG